MSNENFDKFDEEEPFFQEGKEKKQVRDRKADLHFIGYTYNADVESERSLIVNVLKELDTINEIQEQQQKKQKSKNQGKTSHRENLNTSNNNASAVSIKQPQAKRNSSDK